MMNRPISGWRALCCVHSRPSVVFWSLHTVGLLVSFAVHASFVLLPFQSSFFSMLVSNALTFSSYFPSQDPFLDQGCHFFLLPVSPTLCLFISLCLSYFLDSLSILHQWTVHFASSPPAILLVIPHFSLPGPFSVHFSLFLAFDGHRLSIQPLPVLFLGRTMPIPVTLGILWARSSQMRGSRVTSCQP